MERSVAGSDVRSVPSLPQLHIVENDALEGLLFDRTLLGRAFREKCLDASTLFLRHLNEELSAEQSLSELILLSKGLAYQLSLAHETVVDVELPINIVATERAEVLADEAKVRVPYSRFDAGGSSLIVGDTVASGASIVAALDAYRLAHSVHRLYVVSYAGSMIGARRIVDYCDGAGIDVVLLFGLAAFGLGENGFDLSFLHPETLTRGEYRDRARRQFGGRAVSAVGWDFGSQWLAPRKYRQLCWLEAERWGMHGDDSLGVELQPDDLDALWRELPAFGDHRDLPG